MRALISSLFQRWLHSSASLQFELTTFFGGDVDALPIVSRSYSTVDLPNLERAITEYAASVGSSPRAIGYISNMSFYQNELRSLLRSGGTPVPRSRYRCG